MLSDKKFLHKTFPEKKISDIMILYVQKDPYIKTFPHRTFPDNILLEQLLPPANYLIRTWMDGQDEFVIEWKVGNRSVLDCPCRTWCTPRKSSSQRGTGKECVSLNRREGTRLHVVVNRADACPIESHNKNDNALLGELWIYIL